jgi:hypothetical protein
MEMEIASILSNIFPWAITGFLGYISNKLNKKLEKFQLEYDGMNEGVQAVLRDRILQCCTYHQELGYAGVHERENVEHMYEAYHKLGGNGMVTDLYTKFRQLPVAPDKD